jgi:type VI secretion system protein ImpB
MAQDSLPRSLNDDIPKSRITLTYRTQVSGQLADKELPFRLLMLGDFSKKTSVDAKLDLDQRQVRNLNGKNLGQVMKDMGMTLRFNVANEIDAEGGTMPVELPITSMKSFTPRELARNIPKVRALLLLRKLLLEVQANLDNSKKFREYVRTLAKSPEAVEALRAELEKLGDFKGFKLPSSTPAQDTPPAPAPTPKQ